MKMPIIVTTRKNYERYGAECTGKGAIAGMAIGGSAILALEGAVKGLCWGVRKGKEIALGHKAKKAAPTAEETVDAIFDELEKEVAGA